MANDKPQIDFNFDTYKAEQTDGAFGIVIDGQHVELPPAAQLNGIDFFENSLKGDAFATVELLKELLTEEQYEKIRKSTSLASLKEFVSRYFKASGMGTDSGN